MPVTILVYWNNIGCTLWIIRSNLLLQKQYYLHVMLQLSP